MFRKRKLVRSTRSQLDMLVDYMYLHQEFATGKPSGPRNTENFLKEWEALRSALNRHGPDKSVEQWRCTWRDLKKRAKEESAKLTEASMPSVSDSRGKIFKIIGYETALDQPGASGFGLEQNESKKKKNKNIVFITVKQACVDLVKQHGHSVSLFDEEAFRTILQLLPMTMKEKAKITSEYIQKYVDLTGEGDETAMSGQDDQDASDNDYEPSERIITIKGEIQEQLQCTCDARASEDSTKGHDLGCPAASKQPYWNYFEVTTDEATCQICNLTLSWTNITKLKEHLVEKHPNAEFLDDGAEFTRGPASDVWSHEDTEEIYLEEDLDGDPMPTPTAKKRKRTSELFKSTDERPPGLRESRDERPLRSRDKSRAERMTEMRAEREGLSAASRRVIELAPDRFKSLDSFGQYVAELMKLIPKEKCLKYQVQIVQRLLQEQAAAG